MLSEGAGSLLPDQVRPALLWTIDLDAPARAPTSGRAGAGALAGPARLRRRPDGARRRQRGRVAAAARGRSAAPAGARGGPRRGLPAPAGAGVDLDADPWRLEFRSLLPVEHWNAQISLLTGFAAASMMVYAGVGSLRTLPPADPRDVQRLHRTARRCGIEWPAEQLYPDFIRSLDPSKPHHAAMVVACTRLLRGSGYVAFNGEVPGS